MEQRMCCREGTSCCGGRYWAAESSPLCCFPCKLLFSWRFFTSISDKQHFYGAEWFSWAGCYGFWAVGTSALEAVSSDGSLAPGWHCRHWLWLALAYEYSIYKIILSPLRLPIIHSLLSSLWYLFRSLCTSAELGWFPCVEQSLTLQAGPLIEKWQFVSLLRHYPSQEKVMK